MVIACFLIAIMVGMGIGGGGFLVIFLTLCADYEQIMAQGTNLLFFILAGISSVFLHLKKRRINVSLIVKILIFAIPGTLCGSYFANIANPKIPRIVLGILLILSGLKTLFNVIKELVIEKKKKFLKKDFTK